MTENTEEFIEPEISWEDEIIEEVNCIYLEKPTSNFPNIFFCTRELAAINKNRVINYCDRCRDSYREMIIKESLFLK